MTDSEWPSPCHVAITLKARDVVTSTLQSITPLSENSQKPLDRRALTAQLLRRASVSDDATRRRIEEEVIELNLPVAKDIARRYRGRGLDVEDLEQVACLGLVQAVRRFDPSRQIDFLSFAVPTIRGEVRRYFRDRGWMVRPPRSIQEMQARVHGAEESLVQGESWELGVHELGYPAAEARAWLAPALRCLTDRERLILDLRFGQGRTQTEIGEVLGVTQMQVSRLIASILTRLRASLEKVD